MLYHDSTVEPAVGRSPCKTVDDTNSLTKIMIEGIATGIIFCSVIEVDLGHPLSEVVSWVEFLYIRRKLPVSM